VTELFVAKGKRVLHLDLASERPSDEELLGLLLGRSGRLRAPTIRVDHRLLVGFNQEMLESQLL
jgi:arsenate reductase-like glutaredoxin family protein